MVDEPRREAKIRLTEEQVNQIKGLFGETVTELSVAVEDFPLIGQAEPVMTVLKIANVAHLSATSGGSAN